MYVYIYILSIAVLKLKLFLKLSKIQHGFTVISKFLAKNNGGTST